MVQGLAQVALVTLLVLTFLSLTNLTEEKRQQEATTEVVGALAAETCQVAPMSELRRRGLVAECRLARAGKIADAVPDDALPADGEAADQPVVADVVPDDEDVDVSPPSTSAVDGAISRAVDRWFLTNDLRLTAGYEESLRTAVARSLQADPPPRGQRGQRGPGPTDRQVATAVTAALIANPPAPGADGSDGATGAAGQPGRGIVDASLVECAVVFTYTDGTSTSIGPVCGADGAQGPEGPPPSAQAISAGVADYCAVNDGCRGYPIAFTTADGQECTDPDGDRRYDCEYPGLDPLGQG